MADRAPPGHLARQLHTHATWDDLILPAPIVAQLRQIVADVQARGLEAWGTRQHRGVCALFAGPQGTGKTLAAQVLSHTLRHDLHHIDLAAVACQYIGETEKNLAQLFDAATGQEAVLFFDEADALFGKRSAVKDAHDRYANQEAAYLLQRIETHPGLVILATNRKSALDPAFTRRLRHVVDFPLPGAAERKAIWARMLPDEIGAGALDAERLARFPLSGGSIRAIALVAKLDAAQRGCAVTPALVFEAVRSALEKTGLPIDEVDFRCPGEVPRASLDLIRICAADSAGRYRSSPLKNEADRFSPRQFFVVTYLSCLCRSCLS